MLAEEYVVEGASVLQEYLQFKPEYLVAVFYKKNCEDQVLEMMRGSSRPISCCLTSELSPDASLSQSPVWAVVRVPTLDELSFYKRIDERVPSSARDLIVALDHVTDTHNLGAIARSAAFFGVRELVVPNARQATLGRGVLASAQGAFALCDLVQVPNLVRVLENLKEKGYWILATDAGGENIEAVAGVYEKVVLVFGSEDKGVSRLVRKVSDRTVAISSAESKTLDSLNVSVSAGIALHLFSRNDLWKKQPG